MQLLNAYVQLSPQCGCLSPGSSALEPSHSATLLQVLQGAELFALWQRQESFSEMCCVAATEAAPNPNVLATSLKMYLWQKNEALGRRQ